jgi:hypothetical protein
MIDFSKVLDEKKADEEAARAAESAKRKAAWGPTNEQRREAEIYEQLATALQLVGVPCKFRPITYEDDITACKTIFEYTSPANIINSTNDNTLSVLFNLRIVHEMSGSTWSRYRKANGKVRVYIDANSGRPSMYRQDKDGNFRYHDMALELKARIDLAKARDKSQAQASANRILVEQLKDKVGIPRYSSMIEVTTDPKKPVKFTFTSIMTVADAVSLTEYLRAQGFIAAKKEG